MPALAGRGRVKVSDNWATEPASAVAHHPPPPQAPRPQASGRRTGVLQALQDALQVHGGAKVGVGGVQVEWPVAVVAAIALLGKRGQPDRAGAQLIF